MPGCPKSPEMSGWRDSNPRPRAPKARALAKLRYSPLTTTSVSPRRGGRRAPAGGRGLRCGPPSAPGRPRAAPPPPAVAPSRAAKSRARPGRGRWPGCPSGAARLPAALAASRQRFSTEDRSPVAAVIGVSSWPAACRNISGIWVARAAPAETNAAQGGCSPSRPVISASAAPCGVRRSPSLPVCRRSSTYHVSGSCPGCGAVMLVIAAITPGALTSGQARRPRGVVSRPGRERPQAAGDHAPPRRAGNCHRPRGRIRVMIGSPAR